MKRWQQSALLTVIGLACAFNVWGQNETPPIEKESTCEKFENSQWVRKYDQRIRSLISLISLQKPYVDGSLIFPVDVFDNPQFSLLWEDRFGYYLDDAEATLGEKVHLAVTKINNQNIAPIAEQFLIARRYSKYILELNSCASTSKSFLFTSSPKEAIRERRLNGASALTRQNKDLLRAAKYIADFDPKDLSRSQRIHDEVNEVLRNVPNAQLASFMAFAFKSHDTFVASVQDRIDHEFSQFFPTLESWASIRHQDAQVKRQKELETREKVQKESDEKARYAASPDGQLDTAFDQFMTIEQCYKVKEGFTVGYVSLGEYQESRVQVKEIQNLLKPKLKESIDEKWKKIAASFNFTAKPNLFLNEQAIQLACQGAVSSLNSAYRRISPIKGPSKSF